MQVVESFPIWEWRPGATLRGRRRRQTKADEAFLGLHQWRPSWNREVGKQSEKAKKAQKVYHRQSSSNRISK